jgi:hypothetical protein
MILFFGWLTRAVTAWLFVPVATFLGTLTAGLEAFAAIDDAMLASLLLAGGMAGALVAGAYYWLQIDWLLLLATLGAACFGAVLSGRVTWWVLGRAPVLTAARAVASGPWQLLLNSTVVLWLGAWVGGVVLTDDIDITDLQEALFLPALLALGVLGMVLVVQLVRMRLAHAPNRNAGASPEIRADPLLAALLAWMMAAPGGLPWSGITMPEPTAMGGRVGATALKSGQEAIVEGAMRQGARATRRMVTDSGRRIGSATLKATASVRDGARSAARGAQIRRNAAEGARRQEIAMAELHRRHPGAQILTERTLVDQRGEVVRAAHGARRLDVVVVERGQVVRVVEVTSPGRDKFPQLSREELVRDAGGHFIRTPDGLVLRARPTDDVMRVDLATGAIRLD